MAARLRAENLARRVRARIAAMVAGHPIGEALFAQVHGAIRSARASALTRAKASRRQALEADFRRFMDSDEIVSIPTSDSPRTSIVVVLWNQAALTLDCLRGVARQTEADFELIIVDNGSTDATSALLERVRGVRIVRNSDNRGFLLAANQGADAARGEFIAFLNNDAHLHVHALARAEALIAADPTIGAVGGRIILPDDRLQEAGSIIFSDGSCVGYARGRPPEAPEAMFRRDVDYCSGVFLMVRRKEFARLGGFDARYAPAYYEDTDLCMRLWQQGLRVVYEPSVTLTHLEYGSAPADSHVSARLAAARRIFVERWSSELQRHFPPEERHLLLARARSNRRRRVLVLDDRVPVASDGAGYPRARQIVHALVASEHTVTFVPLQYPQCDWGTTWRSLPRTVEVLTDVGIVGLDRLLSERRGHHDLLFVSRPHNMAVVARLHARRPELFQGLCIIYDAEAVFAARERLRAEVDGDMLAAKRAERDMDAEIALADIACGVITVSPGEAALFMARSDRTVHVLGHALSPEPAPTTLGERRNLLFVGRLQEDGSPNVDALTWFVQQSLDLVQLRLQRSVTLDVAGICGAPRVKALNHPSVRLLGPVDDLRPVYANARVFVAPTRFAAGIPHKIHEAAAHGVPVVATRLLARQLGWRDGVELLVADDAAMFAEQIDRLERDPLLWQSIRDNALEAVRRDCDPDVFAATLERIIEAAGR